MTIPNLPILAQTWRNLYYHVPMWYAMMVMMIISVVGSVRFLNDSDLKNDFLAEASARIGVFFAVLGLATGSIWSRVTWSAALPSHDLAAWWPWDPKQSSALVLTLIYMAYFLLRSSFREPEQRARISAVYNVFAAAMIIPLFYIVPKVLGGMHPGSGEEGFMASLKSLNFETRMVFYPASIGFTLLGVWMMELWMRFHAADEKIKELVEND